MAVTNGWGQGVENNTIDWGKGSTNNSNNWGSVYGSSAAGDTLLSAASFSNTRSLDFDGVDDFVKTDSTYSELNGQTKVTFSFWIKPSASHFGEVFEIARNSTNTNTQIRVFIDTSQKLRLQMNNTTLYLRSKNNGITLNAWNHIVFCIDSGGNRGKVFVNGIDDTFVQNIDTLGFDTSSSELYIGESVNNYKPTFNGLIDEFAIWSGADLRSDVSTLYNTGTPGDLNNNGLTAPTNWWRMGDNDGGSGTTLTDAAGSANGTLINSASYDTDVP